MSAPFGASAESVVVFKLTAAQWTAQTDHVLKENEMGIETDTGKSKWGDGSTAWGSLSYGSDTAYTATDIGLGNVTNTSDANKPVSTAQQTALNLKANIASPTFTGTVTLPAAVAGGSLPTTDPHVVGRLWSNSGAVTVSAG